MSLYSQWIDKKVNIRESLRTTRRILHQEEPYSELEYIQSTGTQYIDTLFTPNSNTTFELKFRMDSTDNSQGMVSAYTTWTDNSYLLYTNSGSIYWTYGGKKSCASINTTTSHILNVYKGVIKYDGTTVSNITTGTYANVDSSIYLFSKAGGGSQYARYRLYYFKIWDNGTLVKNFIPVLDSTNTPCLYDTLSKTFHYNLGTGTFNYV